MSEKITIPVSQEVAFGAISSYVESGFPVAGEIQYARVELQYGRSIETLRTYIHSGATVSRNINLGIYDQTDPEDPNGVPVNRVAETGTTSTDGASAFFDVSISVYGVPTPGFYWTGFICDSALVEVSCTQSLAAGFAPVRRETGAGTTLPLTAGTLTNPSSPVIYVAAVET
jgi:hypothetical protein